MNALSNEVPFVRPRTSKSWTCSGTGIWAWYRHLRCHDQFLPVFTSLWSAQDSRFRHFMAITQVIHDHYSKQTRTWMLGQLLASITKIVIEFDPKSWGWGVIWFWSEIVIEGHHLMLTSNSRSRSSSIVNMKGILGHNFVVDQERN